MPANYEMTWDGKARRWQKMYRGDLYKISCRQLGTPETKEASYQAANIWWRSKLAELTAEPKRREEINARLEQQHQWVLSSNKQAREITQEIIERQRIVLAKPPEEITTDDFASLLIDLPGATPTDDTVGYHVARYLRGEQARVDAKMLSMHEIDSARSCLEFFVGWIGSTTSVKMIDPDKWEDYWTHLTSLECSPETKKKRFRFARAFITWLASKGAMPLPPNINLRRYNFGKSIRKIRTMTVDEVRTLVGASTGQLTLHLLLMANCGFTQQDVSDLKQNEVDWSAGTITRKRSKTDDHEDVPTVTYKLWPRTFELLTHYRSQPGDPVLRTKSGKRWMVKRQTNGKFNRTDNTKSVYRHLMKKTGIIKPPKILRKTSSTLLKSHDLYFPFVDLFLGHAAASIADRHYADESQNRFDAAVAWLGEQYGKTITG